MINNFTLLVICSILCLIVGAALAIAFYKPPQQNPQTQSGFILDKICDKKVKDAVTKANATANTKCVDGTRAFSNAMLGVYGSCLSKNPFKITVELPSVTPSNTFEKINGKIGLPIIITPDEPYVIDWGDGTPYTVGRGISTSSDGRLIHVYTKLPNRFTISVYTRPYAIMAVSFNVNGSANYLTYKLQNTDKTYIKEIVTGDNDPSMSLTSGGGMGTSTTPENWGITVKKNATLPQAPCT